MRYLPLLERLDQWQARAREQNPGVIPCRAGCADCCRGPFDISAADVELLGHGFDRLSPTTRREVLARANEAIGRMRALAPDWTAPYAVSEIGERRFDRLTDQLADLPCPLLGADQRCLVYEHRPMVCRMIGVGMKTESGFVIDNACPIQERYPHYAVMPPVGFPLEATELDEDHAKVEAARSLFGDPALADFETTIAGGLVLLDARKSTGR